MVFFELSEDEGEKWEKQNKCEKLIEWFEIIDT